MAQGSRTHNELRKASERIFYEVWMLDCLADTLNSSLPVTSTNNSTGVNRMFNSTGITHKTYINRDSSRVENNALNEAFGIHARALLDFYYGQEQKEKRGKKSSPSQEDDIYAEEFFATPKQWRDVRPTLSKTKLIGIKRRVNKEIAHITYEGLNISPEAKQWLFDEIRTIIQAAHEVFKRHVPKELLGERWGWNQIRKRKSLSQG